MSHGRGFWVYRIYAGDACLYIGQSADVLHRVHQHIRGVSLTMRNADTIKVEWFATRKEAEFAEAEAIRRDNPRYNIQRYETTRLAPLMDGESAGAA